MTAPVSESKPVRVLAAIAAGASAAAGGLPLIPGVPTWVGAAVGLLGVVLAVAVGKYTEGQVTPTENVAAQVLPSGKVVAGDGSQDIPTGSPVTVEPSTPGGYAVP